MKKAIFALSMMSAAMLSANVYAADIGDGTVHFKGEIVDSPCVVSTDSQDQEILLGQVEKSTFAATGDKSPAKPFQIKLENCVVGEEGAKVSVNFNGVADETNKELVSVSTEAGAATGVGIGIYDQSNTLVKINNSTAQTDLKAGQNVLYFTAAYVQAGTTAVTTGYGNADVNFDLTYE